MPIQRLHGQTMNERDRTSTEVFRTHQGIIVYLKNMTTPYAFATIRGQKHIRYTGVGSDAEILHCYPLFPNLKALGTHVEDQLKRKSKIEAKFRLALIIETQPDTAVIVASSEDPVLWNQVLGYIIHGGWGNEEEPPKPRKLS